MDRLLSPPEVCELIGVKPSTLQKMRHRKKGPPYVRLGHRTVRYPESELKRWLEERGAGRGNG